MKLAIVRQSSFDARMHPILEHNSRAWDERVRQRLRHTRTVTDKELADPLRAVDSDGWLGGDITDKRVLCLAAGGGLQSVLYAAAGARVTVVDLSEEMLELDRLVAAERGVQITPVRASMDDLSALGNTVFDIVIQPVSTCYVPHVSLVYLEIARLMDAGGLYISQHKQPISLQTAALPSPEGYTIAESYYRAEPLPEAGAGLMHREAGTMEFIHRWSQLIGDMCRAGFVIEDLTEPEHFNPIAQRGTAAHRYCYAPPYVKLKARRTDAPSSPIGVGRLWTP